MERICIMSTNYAHLKGSHMFTRTVEKLKADLMILLISGYARLARQEMYWERREDCHNLVVSTMVAKTKFLLSANNIYIWLIITHRTRFCQLVVVTNLVSKLPVMQTSNYHIFMNNYFTSPGLLRHLSTISCCNKNSQSKSNGKCSFVRMVKMNKEKHRSSDVVIDVSSNITAVSWKDNKVVNVIPPLLVKSQFNRSNIIVIVKNGG